MRTLHFDKSGSKWRMDTAASNLLESIAVYLVLICGCVLVLLLPHLPN